jgi:7,8-dihydropterin-6-yl-methyl-4-(beta-D-ribofuranosyl)aminobenzene 5'-phosphate synthase
MKWTVLSDNRSCIDVLKTEHGLSILLETVKHRILLDTGASDVFIRNAERMGIDLSTVDYVFISHGHSDHAGGLKYLMEKNNKAQVIVSPDAINSKFFSKRRYLHSITTEWPAELKERVILTGHSQEIDNGLYIIAHISHTHPLPQGNQHLFIMESNGDYVNDDFRHELALYTDGVLFTGCAHSGLENILAACPFPVHTVIGGFHLLDAHESESDLIDLAHRLTKAYPNTLFYTSHCTGDKAFATLKSVMCNQLHAFSCGFHSIGCRVNSKS